MSQQSPYKINLIGHTWAIDVLKQQQQANRVPQSLLITGPLHVGKSTVARFWAQTLNCQGETKPCGNCRSCRKLISGNHPDIRVFDDDQQALKIDQVRELQRELSLSPVEGEYRVAVLCNFERATTGAANALLKTLEEPPTPVVLILTAPDPAGLLPTIVSRCQMLALRLLPPTEISIALQQQWQASPQQAELLTQLAAGRLGWAVQALTDEEYLGRRTRLFEDLLDLLRMHRAERLDYANNVSRDVQVQREALTLWLTIWRDLLLLKSGGQTKIVNLDWLAALQNLAAFSSITQIKETIHRLQSALFNLDRNVNPRLNLEVVLLKLPRYSHG